MQTFTFNVAEHQEYGGLGFRPTWYPHGDPLPGMTVAHDILEHFPNDTGHAEGEFLALGAALWIRGESGYMERNGSLITPEMNIASDLPLTWRYHLERDERTDVQPCAAGRNLSLLDRCRTIVQLSLDLFEEQSLAPPPQCAQELIARWIAKGYRKATRRYKKLGEYGTAYRLFAPIEAEANRALKYAEEGMVLTVRVRFHPPTVHVSCEYPEEEPY